jgi:hypothetical protein
MKTVRITVEGGIVQHVEVPEGITVIVRDYDVDGFPPEVLVQDEQGDSCIETIWSERN